MAKFRKKFTEFSDFCNSNVFHMHLGIMEAQFKSVRASMHSFKVIGSSKQKNKNKYNQHNLGIEKTT